MATLSSEEKRLRGLNKKLKAINDLIEKREGGQELDKQQLEKVSHLDEILEAIQSLVDKPSA